MFSFWILPLSIIGLVISLYLLQKKLTHTKLVCMLGDDDCDAVIKSKYGSLMFGIPNEIFGSLFYAGLIVAVGATLLGISDIFETRLLIVLQGSAALAFLSSLGLALVQAFILKKWCEFCLATAAVNTIIFYLITFQI